MNPNTSCPTCGKPLPADAPMGICPDCLLSAGFGNVTSDTRAEKLRTFEPPRPEELAAHFPQLEILELLGRGGMGAVYKARQKELNRVIALKILPPAIGEEAGFAERFSREAKALAMLDHPGIVTIHDSGRADGLYYFVMEYVDGVNLRHLLQGGRISPREALAIVPQICDALQFAHDHGIVHRDIKPENILIDRRGRVKVADFGIAKLTGASEQTNADGEAASISFTELGKVIGTPSYMAPEQASHPAEVDHRADIYALGVVFYQMLTGELPGTRIEAPSTKVQIDVRLDEVVLRALEKNPEHRYEHASVMKTHVERIASSSPGTESLSDADRKKPEANGTFMLAARARVKLPAIGLMIVGALNLLPLLLFTFAYLANLGNSRTPSGGNVLFVALPMFVVIGVLVILGARRMMELRSYRFCVAASVLAMITPPPFLLIGIPVAIWSLLVLSRKDVREAFNRSRREQGVFKTQSDTTAATSQPPSDQSPPRRVDALQLKSARGNFVTSLKLLVGGLRGLKSEGELTLYADRLVLVSGWVETVIPIDEVRDARVARGPRWFSPAGHAFLMLVYEDAGKSNTLLFRPGQGLFRLAGETRNTAAEWVRAISKAVHAATGKVLPGTNGEVTVVAASPWLALLVLAPLLLIAFALIASGLVRSAAF